ncbi:MAG TPA: monovalent cation:proton antiporter-2 (CPA2) family protein [Rhodocyclaceae bacterium]|nr:monovalent cation:proton antiporter-2 (CPA2) family protein [Rhodocyclaceae bacterium]
MREIVIFLVASGIVVPLFHRFRVSPVLGYLIIGGIVGPFGLGLFVEHLPWLGYATISDLAGVQALAELGVIFLLFMIGLELSLDRLWAMRKLVFGLGSLQILVTAAVIGLVAWEFGNSPAASTVLGACLALSSTAIVMQLLTERRALASPLGRSSFSILLMQDLAVVPILFLVGVLGAKTGGDVGLALVLALGKAAAVIIGIYLGGRVLLRPLFNMVARSRSAEMFMAATLLIIVGAATITGLSGLSMALGAFLAGLLLAETEFRHQIEVDIEPFKGLLLGLFFMSVGMGIDYRVVADAFGWIVASVLGLFVIKSIVTAALCVLFGLPRHVSLEAGLLLGQGGEFAFVVVGLAMSLGLLPADVGQFMLIVTGLTMVVTPLVATTASRLSQWLESRQVRPGGAVPDDDLSAAGELQGHVLLAGFGRVGCMLARVLDADGIPFVAIDNSAFNVAEARQLGLPVYFGDVSRLELLRRAHADTAAMLVLTIDDARATEQVLQLVRAEWPQLRVIARARDALHAAHLIDLGATEVIQETLESGLQMAGRVLHLAGSPEEAVRRRTDAQRELEMAALRELVG